MAIICDRCGREMNDRWEIEGMSGDGGNCTNCGDNLCAACGGKWGDNGECELCSKTLEELEYLLPLRFQRVEKKEMPCADCKKNFNETVVYMQHIYRSDSYGINNCKTRTYEISYRKENYSEKVLFRTNRYHNFREALIEAYKTLKKMGIEVS